MSYIGMVNTIRAVSEAVNPDGLFEHGRTWDASLNFDKVNQQIYLYPATAKIDMVNHYYENWTLALGFYFQDTQDSTPEYREQLIKNADILCRIWLATLYPIEGIEISNIRIEAKYRQMSGTYSGMIMSLDFGTTSDLCSITVDDIIIPPAQTLCEAVKACVGNVKYLEIDGDGSTTYIEAALVDKEILLVATDGRIRKSSDFTPNESIGAIQFISSIKAGQKIYILYK